MIPTEVDVAIVGAGPVGALMGNLLGGRGVRVAVFEREDAPHGSPRAFSCDDEALRIYQQAGLIERLLPTIVQCPEAEFADERGLPFTAIHFKGLDFGLGYNALNFFHQPVLEAILREGLGRFEGASLHLGSEVTAMSQDADGASITVRDVRTGASSEVRARYVLGCDGRRSTARRLAGIELVGSRFAERWIAIAGVLPDPPPTMPLARFVCDPHRPGFVARGPFGQCRFEFMIRPEETAEQMERPEAIARLLAPYVDPGSIEITRASHYTFENKVAPRWRKGRFFLLGDAAHTMPPFMGQGLVSGLRDAANLAWKLDYVLSGAAPDALLDSYEAERRPHVQAMCDTTVTIGHIFLVLNPALASMRNAFIRGISLIPRVYHFIRNMEFKPLPMYTQGFMVGGRRRLRRGGPLSALAGGEANPPEGKLFPQPLVEDEKGRRVLLDDVLGPGFAVLGMSVDPGRFLPAKDPLFGDLDARFLRVLPAGAARMTDPSDIIDVEGKLAAWFKEHDASIAVLRPDHFVFGAAGTAGAEALFQALAAALGRPAAKRL
jgi:3-(3-hydroxy-phenyl)propionate hydroxylase